jgi:hypothetical protein
LYLHNLIVTRKMMYVSPNLITNETSIEEPDDGVIKWQHLVTLDYIHHHNDEDYDGGLSFLDRLNKKLGHKHSEWDIPAFKEDIRSETVYYNDIIMFMLEQQEDIDYYGW